jgi:hypothetical protein
MALGPSTTRCALRPTPVALVTAISPRILAHHDANVIAFPTRASEQQSLQRSTRSWEGFGA